MAGNAVVEEETQRRCFTEALESAMRPWALASEPGFVRAAVTATMDAVERRIEGMTSGDKMRPRQAVKALVENAWLTGYHAGRAYEANLAKAKRKASAAAGKAARVETTRRRVAHVQPSER